MRRFAGRTEFVHPHAALTIGILAGLFIPQRRPEQAFAPHPVGDALESTA